MVLNVNLPTSQDIGFTNKQAQRAHQVIGHEGPNLLAWLGLIFNGLGQPNLKQTRVS
jgi:hypothetical protein